MHRSCSLLTLAGTVTALTALAACSPDAPNPVAPLPEAARAAAATQSVAGRYILASNSGFGSDLAAAVAKLGGAVERVHAGAGIAIVTGISDANASQLSSLKGVSDVQADMMVALDAPLAAARAQVSAPADAISSQSNPARAYFGWLQWNMRLIGADRAWAAGKLGDPRVTVAIIDTGIDYDAYDLNGLVDLTRSVSFVPSDDTLETKYFPGLPGRNSVSDLNGHGTNVATQVSSKAAVFAGVTSRTTLIGVKVLGADGRGTVGGVLSGVLWAADHGADVANMSLGGDFVKAGNGRLVSLINRVFNYASRKGMLVVVAAGNNLPAGIDLDRIGNVEPAYCTVPQVICVSSVGPLSGSDIGTAVENTPAVYSDYGRSAISVAGPGGNATFDAQGNPVPRVWPWGVDVASWVFSLGSKTTVAVDRTGKLVGSAGCESGRCVTGEIGTSQATPHVAGLAALLIAERGTGHPSQIKAVIEQSAVDFGQPGTDPYYGKGRISVSNALGL